jgi:hypothetical protein
MFIGSPLEQTVKCTQNTASNMTVHSSASYNIQERITLKDEENGAGRKFRLCSIYKGEIWEKEHNSRTV